MPFGLQNAGQSFQRFMGKVLDGLDFCFVYVDDVLIMSKSPEEHMLHLREVLSRLAKHGIVLNGEKCVLGVPEVQFLGHMVSARGIIPLPKKVATIRAFPRPGTVGQLMSYLGMVNFYRRFIKGAAGVLKPLTDAQRGASGKAAKLEWSTSMLVAFESSKKQMVQVTHLAHPGKMATLALSMDASGTHVGAALQQEMSGSLQPLGFFSRKLNTAEQKY